jgi:hypothetical protein
MKEIKKFEIGARVRIGPQHWLRGGELGEVVGYERRGRNNWLVRFESSFPGGGIDGDKLWFDQNEISELSNGDGRADNAPNYVEDGIDLPEQRMFQTAVYRSAGKANGSVTATQTEE